MLHHLKKTVVALLLVIVSPTCGVTSDSVQPNVLLIVSDDQRPDTIAALGNEVIRTPNLDELVRHSSVFTRAICANPICTPSRGEILSGCSGCRTGVLDFGSQQPDGFVSLAETMQRGGYQTSYVGKWHNKGRPSDYGYQATAGLFSGGGSKWMKPNQVDAHGRSVTGYSGWIFQSSDGKEKYPELGVGLTGDISEEFADASVKLIEQPHEKPFFLHVNFTAPHDPLLVPPGFEDDYDPETIPLPMNFRASHPFDHGNQDSRDELLLPQPRTKKDVREDLAVYYAVISHLDLQVGRILRALDDSGERDNTIVIFTSDHGLAMGSHGLRGKQNMYEHTMNVPMLISGPGIPDNQRFNAQMYLRDLYPTVCDLVGISVPDAPGNAGTRKPIDGRSVVPVLRGEQDQVHEYVFGYFRDFQRMIRGDRWKLIHYPQINKWQLFDLVNDPKELNNLADAPQHAETKMQLQEELRQWQTQVGDPIVVDRSAINASDRGAISDKDVIRVGVIGLDTSHASAFTKLLNDPDAPAELSGCRVVVACPKNSPDIPSSLKSGTKVMAQMKELGIESVDSIDELLQRIDVVLLETNDGRVHLQHVIPVLKAGKPVFVDKPVAGSLADAVAIYELAEQYKTPIFSSSSLRYTDGAKAILAGSAGDVLGCDFYSPCPTEKTHPDLFWYGIHGVEPLFTLMGVGCETVTRASTANTDVVVGTWDDGRIGTYRGRRNDNNSYVGGYGGTVFGSKGIESVGEFSGYAPLLVEIVKFFKTRQPPVSAEETIEIYTFMEAADESERNGGAVIRLDDVLAKAKQAATQRINAMAP